MILSLGAIVSRIFISHSSKNNAEALALRDWLATQGWNDVFLDIDPELGLVAADRWRNALNAAVGRCRAVIFLLSPEWRASEHCISELDLATDRGAECIGVIIKKLPHDRIPTGLGGENQMIDLMRGGTPVSFMVNPPPERKPVTVTFPGEDLRALRNGLAKLGLVGFETESFPWPPEGEPDRAPYRGLQALDVQDAGVFFGRDSDLVRAREQLIRLRAEGGRKLVVIQGASGSGKSSFMRAGLLPRLEREDHDLLVLPLTRPQTAPITGNTGLAASLEAAFRHLGEPRAEGDLITALKTDAEALPPLLNRLQVLAMQRLVGEAAPQVDRPPTLVLPVDQAEELFANEAGDEATAMRRHLAAALTRGPDTIGLLTIRSDRFALLQNDSDLKTLLETFNLPPVSTAVYREAILKPAARATPPIEVDPALAEALINDTAVEGADPLPLLAFTLERLYRRYGRSLHKIDFEHYEALGGLTGSIDAAIAEAFVEPTKAPAIPSDRKERERLLEAAFIPSLVDVNPANGEPLGRIAPEREIPADARSLVVRLLDARLLVSDTPAAENEGSIEAGQKETTYRVAHEALLRNWSWLRGVLDQQAKNLNTIGIVEGQAKAWDKTEPKRDRAWLDLRGERLKEALALVARPEFKARLAGLPTAYLDACRKLERAATWRRRRAYAAVALLLALGGTAWTTQQQWQGPANIAWHTLQNWLINDLSKPGTVFKDCSTCPEMVVVPAGSFEMGSPETESDREDMEGPQRKVTIPHPLAVGRFEVTFDNWQACVDARHCNSNKAPDDMSWGEGRRPVMNVTKNHIREYLDWISQYTGQTYWLLTEAEWEYAARAGSQTRWSFGDDETRLGKHAWFKSNSDGKTQPVGMKLPNKFGLYDMHGNVSELVQDCLSYYDQAPSDGTAYTDAAKCTPVVRGGSRSETPKDLRAAARYYAWIASLEDMGFRVARALTHTP